MRPELELAAQLASEYLASLDTHRISDETDPDELRSRLARELSDDGLPPEQVIQELHDDAAAGLLNSASGRFFGTRTRTWKCGC